MSDTVISRLPQLGMLTIRADLTGQGERISTALSALVPPTLGVAKTDVMTLLWFSPDELLMICPSHDLSTHHTALRDALAGEHHLLVDASDMRAVFEVSGPRVREVMAKLVPIDMHPDAFGPGQVRRTQLAQVAVALWMTDAQTVRVLCFRSVADYVGTCLSTAADPQAAVDLGWN